MAAKLYRVQTRTDAIQGYDDVLVTWTAAGRDAPPAPYADVIEGLGSDDEADLFRRQAVDELFTFEEAEAWVAYLQRYGYESSEVEEEPLPLSENAVALSDVPVGGGVDQIMPIREEEDYPFAFPVYGCYDLREHSAWSGSSYRFGEDPYPGEIEDLTNVLDGRRKQVAEELGIEHPLFRLLNELLRTGGVEELRVARAASDSFHVSEYLEDEEDFEDISF